MSSSSSSTNSATPLSTAPPNFFSNLDIVKCLITKLFLTTGLRFLFPFAPFLSEELGVTTNEFFRITAAMDAAGMLGLGVGPLLDTYGAYAMHRAVTCVFWVILPVAAAFKNYWVLLVCWVAYGAVYQLLLSGFMVIIGSFNPHKRLGRVNGLVETSWALAAIVCFPIVGVLIDRFGYHAPFIFLTITGCSAATVVALTYPGGRRHHAHTIQEMEMAELKHAESQRQTELEADPLKEQGSSNGSSVVRQESQLIISSDIYLTRVSRVLSTRIVRGAVLFGFFMGIGQTMMFSNFGVWLSDEYDLDAESVGFASFLLGAGELTGSMTTSWLSSHVHLFNVVAMSILGEILAFVALSFCHGAPLGVSLTVLYFVFFMSELVIVSSMSFYAAYGSAPELRGTTMSVFFGAFAVGRMTASLISSPVFDLDGIRSVAAVCALSFAVSGVAYMYGWSGGLAQCLSPCTPPTAPDHKAATILDEDAQATQDTIDGVSESPTPTV